MSDNSYAERKRRDKVDRVMGCLAAVALRTSTTPLEVWCEWLVLVDLYLGENDPSCERAIQQLEVAARLPHRMGRGSLELLRTTLADAISAAEA